MQLRTIVAAFLARETGPSIAAALRAGWVQRCGRRGHGDGERAGGQNEDVGDGWESKVSTCISNWPFEILHVDWLLSLAGGKGKLFTNADHFD